MFLLGLDIGSSSIKAALVDARNGRTLGAVHSPDTEMEILAVQPGWAEQAPDMWWENCRLAIQRLLQQTQANPADIAAIGISYQMHGLVAIDREGRALRPSIIWCDSRAVSFGEKAFRELGEAYCLDHYLNGPGNFTASKLKWVQTHEPALYERIHHVFLPGDYIAFRLTGEPLTTMSGLSEGILWDFMEHKPAQGLLDYYGFDRSLIPSLAPTFGHQGRLTMAAAETLGLKSGTPVTYRAGDQPNNALALNVLEPGEVAATGGTSGVVYGVVDRPAADRLNRVNSFAHVNHLPEAPRIGVLLCINGTGIQYGWMRKHVAAEGQTYPELEQAASAIPVGTDGLQIIPFGNGAERMLGNRDVGASIHGLQFNRHTRAHLYRAALEGIAFSFVYGMDILRELGVDSSLIRVGNDNLFQSAIFSNTIAQLTGCRIEMLRTNGAAGAAIAAGVGVGLWPDARAGLNTLEQVQVFEPGRKDERYQEAYANWVVRLKQATGLAP